MRKSAAAVACRRFHVQVLLSPSTCATRYDYLWAIDVRPDLTYGEVMARRAPAGDGAPAAAANGAGAKQQQAAAAAVELLPELPAAAVAAGGAAGEEEEGAGARAWWARARVGDVPIRR